MDKENNEKLTDQLLRGIYRMCVNRDDCEGCPFYITKCTFEEPKPSTWFDEETIEAVSKPAEEVKPAEAPKSVEPAAVKSEETVAGFKPAQPAAEVKSEETVSGFKPAETTERVKPAEPSEGFKLVSEGFKSGSEHSEGLKFVSDGYKLGSEPSDGLGLYSESEEGSLGRSEEAFFFRRSEVEEEVEEPEETAEATEEVAEETTEAVAAETAEAPAEQPAVLETINQQANDDDSEGTWLVSTTMGSVFTKYVFICSKCGYRKESFFSITPMTYCPECASKKNNPVPTQ